MTDARHRRLLLVFCGLVLATLTSVLAGEQHGDGAVRVGVVVTLAIALVKVRFVGLDFMELRTAPPALRWLFEGWVVVVGATLVGLYVLA